MKKTIFGAALLTAVLVLAFISCVSTEKREEQEREVALLVLRGGFYAYQFEFYKNPPQGRRMYLRWIDGPVYFPNRERQPPQMSDSEPSEQDIDRAISAYEAALNQWFGNNEIYVIIKNPVNVIVSATKSEVQALLTSARNAKQQWQIEKQQREQQLAATQQAEQQAQQATQQAEQAELARQATTPNSPDDFDIIQNAQGGITIRGYIGTRLIVVIPETISGIRVTEIASFAFRKTDRRASLRSVVIPNTVTTIGYNAFLDNAELSSVVLPNAITRIEQAVFKGCKSLQSITIPNSVTTINDEAFMDCGLTSVTLSNRLEVIGDSAFRNNQITSIQLPASLNTIGESAFNNNQITNLVIPGNVVRLEANSFGRNPLASLVIPTSLAKRERIVTARSGAIEAWYYTGFRGTFANVGAEPNQTLTSITLPANVDEDNMTFNFEDSLVNFWKSQNRRAGTYVKEGRIWTVR